VSESNVSETVASPAADGKHQPAAPAGPRRRALALTPLTAVIVAGTLLGLGLRLYQLTRPGFLLSVTEYDDGPYFGSALHLVNGSLPYRDFLIVQPPGITLLMVPAALLSKVAGTAGAMAAGRILTAFAGAAAVALAGLLVRHRGIFATVVVCGICAVYPDSVQAAHTVLVEPWLVLFCLIGALAVFDGDRLTASRRRLAWGGAAFGFAGTVEVWAIVPVIVIAVLGLRWPRRLAAYLAGVAAAFLIPVLPFAALGPRQFYYGLVEAQVGTRFHATRVPVWTRLKDMTGLTDLTHASHSIVLLTALVIAVVVLGSLALASLAARRPPPALDVFAVVTTGLVVAMFMWPDQFHYHFGAFLAPFLALALALPGSSLLPRADPAAAGDGTGSPALTLFAASLAGLAIIGMTVVQVGWEHAQPPKEALSSIAAARRLIPPGACVVSDEVSLMIMADRFISDVPGCPVLMDTTGTDLALSHGRLPATGAARSPALDAVWRSEFGHAQYVWLSHWQHRRVPWTPALRTYFSGHFTRVLRAKGVTGLYRRVSL
jgi:alpha-1,2-mannosyltransferase